MTHRENVALRVVTLANVFSVTVIREAYLKDNGMKWEDGTWDFIGFSKWLIENDADFNAPLYSGKPGLRDRMVEERAQEIAEKFYTEAELEQLQSEWEHDIMTCDKDMFAHLLVGDFIDE